MSYKFSTIQNGNSYVLPKRGKMKCDVTAFLSPTLFDQTSEDLWAQAAQAAEYEGATGLFLMPDTHFGFGIPVGGVLVTEDTIVQAGSGYDISCGVVYLKINGLTAEDIADWDKRKQWVDQVELRVATGNHSERSQLMGKRPSHKFMQEVIRYGARPLGVSADLCERQYIPIPDEWDHAVDEAFAYASDQFGSVGGGNHFIEMQVDRDGGSVWVMIHCGSRAFGWRTADHFFYAGAKLRGLVSNRREESWLRIDEPLGQSYWHHHNVAANYAVANRHIIVHGVREATQLVFGKDVGVYYEISHNLVQEETLVLPDGSTKRGFVHRKGATRAFPAGHPGLKGSVWEKTGHPCLIPGSMLDGAAILFPKQGAYRSACSVNHGSGRLMARGEAKRELGHVHDEIDQEMRTIERVLGGTKVVGIVGNTERTPLDECGHVYKDLDSVIQVLEDEGIAELHHRLYPVANLKGTN